MSDDRPHAGMAEAPLVSVVVPTYNRWPLVGEAVESILAQDMDGMEALVVDDGSTDGTAERVAEIDASVRVVRQQNLERGAARNRGAREARGRFLCFLDADDVLEPWCLSQFASALERHPDAAVFSAGVVFWDPATGRTRRRRTPRRAWRDVGRAALRGTVLPLPGLVVSRPAFETVDGFPEDRAASGSEDRVYLARLARELEVVRLPRHAVRVREHPGRSMGDHAARMESSIAATRILLDDELERGAALDSPRRRRLIAGDRRFRAAHAYALGDMRQARSLLGEAWPATRWYEWVVWNGRLWCQTWLGARGSRLLRRAKERAVWR